MRPDVSLAREKYRRHAQTYDRDTKRSDFLRRRAVARLDLRAGDIVLDVGCGTGLSFPLLEEDVGAGGRIIGVEASPEMLARARERAELNGWKNVTLVESAAAEAVIPEPPDAILFVLTHDVMRSPRALENAFGQSKAGARVTAAGGKWSRRWALPVNMVIWYVSRRYVTTFEGFARPWSHLTRFVPDLSVEPLLLGGFYVAWGRLSASAAHEQGEGE